MRGFLFFSGILLLSFGGCTVQRDLRLLAFGESTQAQVTLVRREGGSDQRYRFTSIEFTFTDALGDTRTGKDRLPAEWKRQANQQITVTYLPRSPHISAVKGNWQIFHWMLSAIGFSLVAGRYATAGAITHYVKT